LLHLLLLLGAARCARVVAGSRDTKASRAAGARRQC